MNNDWHEDKKIIENFTISIDRYMSKRKREKKFNKKDFITICEVMAYVMLKWVGETWVGCKKEREVENQYQKFWEMINRFICFLQMMKYDISEMEKAFLDSIIYNGFIYRYLGVSSSAYRDKKTEPYFSPIYVSWSKEKENSYFKAKLYGSITRLHCNIKSPYFGMDIEGFDAFYESYINKGINLARGHEREVVFPTIKNQIYKIEYLEYKEDMDGDIKEISTIIPRYSNGIDNFGGFKNESIG